MRFRKLFNPPRICPVCYLQLLSINYITRKIPLCKIVFKQLNRDLFRQEEILPLTCPHNSSYTQPTPIYPLRFDKLSSKSLIREELLWNGWFSSIATIPFPTVQILYNLHPHKNSP